VELIWIPISLNCEFIPIPEMDLKLLSHTDFNYVGTRLETNGRAIMTTLFPIFLVSHAPAHALNRACELLSVRPPKILEGARSIDRYSQNCDITNA
jgi:hypothetical protein